MTAQQTRDLAIRILGVYYLAHAIIFLPQIAGACFISGKEAGSFIHKTILVMATIAPIALYFVIAYLLCLRTKGVMAVLWPTVEEDGHKASAPVPLTTWVGLIGLFYFIGSFGGVASELWRLGTHRDAMGSWLSYTLIAQAITLVLAVLCLVKAGRIAEYLNTWTTSDTRPPPVN